MGSGLIEGQDIALEEALELLLLQDQEMIQTFSSHTPQKTFTDGIRAARVRYGVRRTLMPPLVQNAARISGRYPESDMLVCVHRELPPAVVAPPKDR